jgi:hypothetical protein
VSRRTDRLLLLLDVDMPSKDPVTWLLHGKPLTAEQRAWLSEVTLDDYFDAAELVRLDGELRESPDGD